MTQPELLVSSSALATGAFFGLRELACRAGIVKRWKIGIYLPAEVAGGWYLAWNKQRVATRWTRRGAEALSSTWLHQLEQCNYDLTRTRVFIFPSFAPAFWREDTSPIRTTLSSTPELLGEQT